MQPFGLLNFLQKALSSNEDNTTGTQPTENEPVQEEPESATAPPTPSPEETAYQAFLYKHEQFSRRIRKKNDKN